MNKIILFTTYDIETITPKAPDDSFLFSKERIKSYNPGKNLIKFFNLKEDALKPNTYKIYRLIENNGKLTNIFGFYCFSALSIATKEQGEKAIAALYKDILDILGNPPKDQLENYFFIHDKDVGEDKNDREYTEKELKHIKELLDINNLEFRIFQHEDNGIINVLAAFDEEEYEDFLNLEELTEEEKTLENYILYKIKQG